LIGIGSWKAVAALVRVAGISIGSRKCAAAVRAADAAEVSVGGIHGGYSSWKKSAAGDQQLFPGVYILER
jgi:hypothetical protein